MLKTITGVAALVLLATAVHAAPAATVQPATTGAPAFGTRELDAAIEAKATEKGFAPAGPCDDASFLRRLSLDLNGVIPTPQDIEAFLADTRPDKRSLKIEELMARPEFDRHLADEMRQFMMGKSEAKAIQIYARNGIEAWLQSRVQAKDGYDRIVSQLITAEGPFIDNPATGFLMKKDATPEDLTAKTGKVFLGAQIQCAQCHDHPFEKWTQKDFYGMVGFFARTRTQPIPEPALELIRKGVPLQMVRQLVLQPLNQKNKGLQPGKGPFGGPGAQGKGPGQGRFAKMFAQLPPEEKVRRMMKRMDMMDDGMMNDSGTGTGAQQPPPPAEIVAMADRIRTELENEVPMIDLLQNPGAKKGKKPYRRIPVVFEAPRGEAIIPDPKAMPGDDKKKSGTQVAPRFLDGTTPAIDGKRRQQLAAWMTAPSNPYFARAAVNRFFSLLTGQPLVAPVDNVVNPSDKTLGATLDQLAAAFVKSGYDLRWLVRTITMSKSYQRELATAPGAEKGRAVLSTASARQLTPEQLFASFLQATGAEEMARGVMGDKFEKLKDNFLRQFVFTFENDEGAEVELFHETIPQALMMMNSGLINRPVQAGPGGMLAKIAAGSADPKQRIDQLYLATLSRHARPEELTKLAEHVAGRGAAAGADMSGMDDPAPVTASDFIEDLPRQRPGRRFGMGLGAQGQLNNWRERLGLNPKRDQAEPGGWAGVVGMRARFQDREKRFAGAQAAVQPVDGAPPSVAAPPSVSAPPSISAGPNPWKSPGERQAYEDIFWSLVSCSEFLYNH